MAPVSIKKVNPEVLSRTKIGPLSPPLGFFWWMFVTFITSRPSPLAVSLAATSAASLLPAWFPRIIYNDLRGDDSAFFFTGELASSISSFVSWFLLV